MTKKTLIVTTTQDVSPFTDEYIDETIVKLIRQTADACGLIVEIKLVKEDVETPTDVAERLLRSALGEIKANDDQPGIRIESNGEVLNFKVNDERPRD